ncbi:MAG: adenylosuccinate lyase [Acidimicrobiaceae bacterium]|nr:adenylosuccinate lyase [Acidimicrobiaceae bacterium]
MIDRYSPKEIADIFSDQSRFATWLEVEILATEAWATLGVVPAEHAKAVRIQAPSIDASFVREVNEREQVTNHDVAAFVDVVQSKIGFPWGSWIHYGLTSSDVVDTSLCLMMTRALDVVIIASEQLLETLVDRSFLYFRTPMLGRTHGMAAEPTTFGNKLALWALQVNRDLARLRSAREVIAVGKLSGAVGTYSNVDPFVESYVCNRLGLRNVPATQVIARDRHAQVLYSLTALASSIETFATEIRHLQRTEVQEAEEYFSQGQKGSSAMPHKRNPILAERLVGMSRIMRGYLVSALEDVALWHERDISHSSVERVVVPDAFSLALYMTKKFDGLISHLVVYPEKMLENIDRTLGLVFSQPILLALVASGLSRDEAYVIVQRCAHKAWDSKIPFAQVLAEDPEVSLSEADLVSAMDLQVALKNVRKTFDCLLLELDLTDEKRKELTSKLDS